MKITIDKLYTAGYQMEKVKADIKEFKECFTERDILSEFRRQYDWHKNECADIIRCEISAFPAGWACGDYTSFSITLWLEGYHEMNKLSFYMDNGLNLRENLVDVWTYKREQ